MNSFLIVLALAAAGGPWQCAENAEGLYQCNAKDLPVAAGLERSAASSDALREVIQPQAGTEAPLAEATGELAAEPESTAVGQELDKYVVQIAAYRDKSEAQARLARLGENLRVVPTTRSDGTWYLIMLGSYLDRADAEEAAIAFIDRHPEADYWVRSITGLRREMLPVAAQ